MAYGAYAGGSANPGGGMDAMTDGPMEEKGEGAPHDESKEGEDGYDQTGILPKALMAGKDFKVGDEIVLQITRVGENDFEVKYASDKGGEGGEKEGGYGEETTPTDRGVDRSSMEMGSMLE